MKLPANFYRPLAIGAPLPLRELPVRPERMIERRMGAGESTSRSRPNREGVVPRIQPFLLFDRRFTANSSPIRQR